MKKWSSFIVLACILALSTTAFAGYPIKIKDARGKVVTIKAKPMRIVSLIPSNTEILYSLGLGNRVVGVTKYCNYPHEAVKKPKIGDMIVNTESVVALRPDLVVAHAFANDSAICRLEKLGLTVFAIDPKTLDQLMHDIRALGKVTASPNAAESLAKKMERKITTVKAGRAKKKSENVLVVIQANPLWVAGPKTFVDEMIDLAHAKNVARDARSGFVTFSKELAISRNPDVIIVGSKQDADFFLTNPTWKTTSAAKHKRVYIINNDLVVRPGPRLVDGLVELAKVLDSH